MLLPTRASRLLIVAALSATTLSSGLAAQRPGAKTAADRPELAADGRDKMICKRFIRTGSLIDGYRSCKTKWEWERERQNILYPRAASGSCQQAESGNCEG